MSIRAVSFGTIPGDVRVVGMDDVAFASPAADDALMHQPCREIGMAAMALIVCKSASEV